MKGRSCSIRLILVVSSRPRWWSCQLRGPRPRWLRRHRRFQRRRQGQRRCCRVRLGRGDLRRRLLVPGARRGRCEKFMDANPDVSVSGSGNGSGKGLTAVAAGTVTIGNSDVFAETKLEADQVKNLSTTRSPSWAWARRLQERHGRRPVPRAAQGHLLRPDHQLEGGRRRRRYHRRPQPQGRLRHPRHLRGCRLWRRGRRL